MVEINQISALLEKLILPTIQDQLYNKTVLMKYLAKDNKGLTFNNDKIYITAQSSGHSGVTFTWATGSIWVGKNTNQQMVIDPRYGYGSHIIWDSTIQVAKGKPGSLISIVTDLGESLKTEFQKSLNRQLFGKWNWTLTTVTTGASSTATHTVGSTRHLRVWQKLWVWTKAEIEAWTADEVTVSTINSKTSVTFTTSITTLTNDVVAVAWVYSGWVYHEIQGLQNAVSNNVVDSGSSFQWITRATNDWVNSYVDTSSAVLTEAMMISMLTDVNEFWTTDIIVTTPALRDKYASLLASNKRYVNTVDLKGWFKGIEVSAWDRPVALVADYDCPAWEMFFLDTTTLSLAQLNPLEYLKDWSGWIMTNVYDSNWYRLPAYQVAMKFYGNLVCSKPRANWRFTNKTVS